VNNIIEYLPLHEINAIYYFGGLPIETRDENFTNWVNGNSRVLVATGESFGFGMHNQMPPIRFVIHYGMPDSLTKFYHVG
jgi:superfamily II DNA helicase RecQ